MSQRGWRITGGISIAIAGLMVFFGPTSMRAGASPLFLVIYWGIFLVAVGVALWCVLLDLRYIRYEYSAGERDIFQETLGSEEFRRAIAEAQRAEAEEKARQQDPPQT